MSRKLLLRIIGILDAGIGAGILVAAFLSEAADPVWRWVGVAFLISAVSSLIASIPPSNLKMYIDNIATNLFGVKRDDERR